MLRIFGWNFKIEERCKGVQVHSVDLGESFPTSVCLQKLASIQPRTSLVKFARSPRTYPPGVLHATRGRGYVLLPRVPDRPWGHGVRAIALLAVFLGKGIVSRVSLKSWTTEITVRRKTAWQNQETCEHGPKRSSLQSHAPEKMRKTKNREVRSSILIQWKMKKIHMAQCERHLQVYLSFEYSMLLSLTFIMGV